MPIWNLTAWFSTCAMRMAEEFLTCVLTRPASTRSSECATGTTMWTALPPQIGITWMTWPTGPTLPRLRSTTSGSKSLSAQCLTISWYRAYCLLWGRVLLVMCELFRSGLSRCLVITVSCYYGVLLSRCLVITVYCYYGVLLSRCLVITVSCYHGVLLLRCLVIHIMRKTNNWCLIVFFSCFDDWLCHYSSIMIYYLWFI